MPKVRQRRWVTITMALVVCGFAACQQPAATAQTQGNAVYEKLRGTALRTKPGDIGIASPAQGAGVYGVVMDLDMGGQTATVVSFASGDASIYLSTGGGIIGGGSHPAVADAARKFVELAQSSMSALHPTSNFPRPGPGRVIFYILTASGVETAEGGEDALSRGGEPISPLFAAGQDVITRLRQTSPPKS